MKETNTFQRLCWREFILIKRQYRVILNTCLFFMMVMAFFPLAFPADPSLLRMILPGLVWTAVLFAVFLSSERLFQQEVEEGVLEQWVLSNLCLTQFVRAKLLVHWVMNLCPILIFCPLLSCLFQIDARETFILALSIFLGTPSILCFCAMSRSFCPGQNQKGSFMALILLPLTLPVMIFGGGALTAGMQGLPVSGYFALLLAFAMVSFMCLPLTVAAALRIGSR